MFYWHPKDHKYYYAEWLNNSLQTSDIYFNNIKNRDQAWLEECIPAKMWVRSMPCLQVNKTYSIDHYQLHPNKKFRLTHIFVYGEVGGRNGHFAGMTEDGQEHLISITYRHILFDYGSIEPGGENLTDRWNRLKAEDKLMTQWDF